MKGKVKLKDGIVGRPTRLNKKILDPNGKGYAEVMLIGDVHYGSPQCDVKRFLAMLDYCIKNHFYVLLMGDLVEMATRDSIGAGIYEQYVHGESQIEWMMKHLRSLADAGLILGLHNGNHEERVYNMTGVNISKAMARELGVTYLGDACWSSFKVGSQKYAVYSLHGRTGARYDGTVLKAVENISNSFYADLVAMGHAHKQVSSNLIVETVVNDRVVQKKKFIVVTGSYLGYDGGYWQKTGGQISKLGSPKVKFHADRHDLSISW